MNLTFDLLKEKTTNIMSNTPWDIVDCTNDEFKSVHRTENISLHYIRYDELTRTMNQVQKIPCLLYRKKRVHQDEVVFDYFIAVIFYQEKFIMGEVMIQKNTFFYEPCMQWRYLDDEWCHDSPVEIEYVKALESFNQQLTEFILELPDIRLYVVTGLLNQKG